jgi:DNA-directed RNA polymerase specialized sigma24 family protein
MAAGEMVSRAVTQVPEGKQAFEVWLEKILRNHFLDIKRIYNKEIASDSIELIKPGNDTSEAGNAKLFIEGDYLIIKPHDGSDWVDIGWKIKLA